MQPSDKDIILVDTSVWIHFLRGVENPHSLYLRSALPISTIAICPTILQEILQGVSNIKKRKLVDSYLKSLMRMQGEAYQMAEKAAEIYRGLRDKGITIRKPNDCLIAAYAIKYSAIVLQDDKDFGFIAQNSALKIVEL